MGNYTDYTVQYTIRPEDYAFSTGSSDSAYPGEEYFLFPNWNNAKGCGYAFWVGKYAASRADATTTSQGISNTPVSKKGKPSWVNTAWSTQVNSCLTKGNGFHCIRNREWVSIALWTEKMGIDVKGNFYGSITNGINIDGQGLNITSAMADNTDSNYKILTGSGPSWFNHNGKDGGISDLSGNVWIAVDGLQLRDGVPYALNENNTAYVSLGTDVITASIKLPIINYINNSTNDLLNEGLPVETAGMAVSGNDTIWKNNSGTRICYRGGACNNGASDPNSAGMWALSLVNESSHSDWHLGFRLACTLNT